MTLLFYYTYTLYMDDNVIQNTISTVILYNVKYYKGDVLRGYDNILRNIIIAWCN